MTNHEQSGENNSYDSALAAATEAFDVASSEPYASDKLEDAYNSFEKALNIGLKEGRITPSYSFEYLAEIAEQASTVAANNKDLTTADGFTGRRAALLHVVETLLAQTEITEPTATGDKKMDGKKQI